MNCFCLSFQCHHTHTSALWSTEFKSWTPHQHHSHKSAILSHRVWSYIYMIHINIYQKRRIMNIRQNDISYALAFTQNFSCLHLCMGLLVYKCYICIYIFCSIYVFVMKTTFRLSVSVGVLFFSKSSSKTWMSMENRNIEWKIGNNGPKIAAIVVF